MLPWPRSARTFLVKLLVFSDIHNDWKRFDELLAIEADYYIAAGDQVTPPLDQEAGASNGCTFAPLIRSHITIAISPRSAGKALRKARS